MPETLNEQLLQAEPAGSAFVMSQPRTGIDNRSVSEETPAVEGNATCGEQQLVDSARQGDATAFGELIKRHYSSCLKRASSLIRNPTDAEDEVQNACWKAFERLGQFRGDGTFSAWLSRIVENQCLMRIREDRQARSEE